MSQDKPVLSEHDMPGAKPLFLLFFVVAFFLGALFGVEGYITQDNVEWIAPWVVMLTAGLMLWVVATT